MALHNSKHHLCFVSLSPPHPLRRSHLSTVRIAHPLEEKQSYMKRTAQSVFPPPSVCLSTPLCSLSLSICPILPILPIILSLFPLFIPTHTCMHAHRHTYMHTHTLTCTHLHTHLHTHTHSDTYLHSHPHTHTLTHTLRHILT